MKLISLKTFQERYFAKGEAPTEKTIKTWINKSEIPGRKLGGKYFIDCQQFEACKDNDLVNKVLLSA